MKSNTKTQVPVLSRQSQKILIITAVLAYLLQSVMIGQFFYTILTEQVPSVSAFVLYPIITMALPALSFLLIYFISGTSYAKLWRTCQATMVAFLAIIAEGFLSAVNLVIFSSQLGYANVPAVESTLLLQALPSVVVLAAVAVAGVWLRGRKMTPSGNASVLFQKGFIVLLPLFTIGQMTVMYFGYGAQGQAMDLGALTGVLSSLVVPAIVWAILFLLTARGGNTFQRAFTSLTFVVIGVLLFMACTSAAYLITFMNIGPQGGEQNTIVDMAAPLLALMLFVGLVAWHKQKRLL